MALSLRHRITIGLLASYWPALFVFAHIPVPMWVRRAGVSDKVLHFLVYLVLVFLVWFAVSPNVRVSLRRAATWWVSLILVVYGIVDELVQGLVGRSCDIRDFGADVAGTATGLVLFSFLPFWPAALVVMGVVIFGVTNLTRVSLADLLPITNAMFHVVAHAVFTLLWIRNAELLPGTRNSGLRWVSTALAGPMALLLTVKVFSAILRRKFEWRDVVASIAGILIGVAVVVLARAIRRAVGKNSKTAGG
jgi:VanZ family protein